MKNIIIKEILSDKFEVTVNSNAHTKHIVILPDEYYESLTRKKVSKVKLIKYSFEFLLDRESNKEILSSFELKIISRYFPDYETKIKKKLNL